MIKVQGINVEVTEALQNHIEEQALKIEKFHIINLTVHLTVESSHDFKCTISSSNVSTESTSEDMYVAITEAFEKAHTVLEKKRGKALAKRHKKADFSESIDE